MNPSLVKFKEESMQLKAYLIAVAQFIFSVFLFYPVIKAVNSDACFV